MSTLRDTALAALAARKQAQEDEAAEILRQRAEAGLARVAKTQLKKWFPKVTWTFVGDLADGTTLVREKDGADIVLGVTPVTDLEGGAPADEAGSSNATIGVYTPLPFGDSWTLARPLHEAADLGAYIEDTEPKAEPAPEPAPAP